MRAKVTVTDHENAILEQWPIYRDALAKADEAADEMAIRFKEALEGGWLNHNEIAKLLDINRGTVHQMVKRHVQKQNRAKLEAS